ncbi:hypothetical protein MAUB1S_05156 [Mycolicibacterium aubagnense]
MALGSRFRPAPRLHNAPAYNLALAVSTMPAQDQAAVRLTHLLPSSPRQAYLAALPADRNPFTRTSRWYSTPIASGWPNAMAR